MQLLKLRDRRLRECLIGEVRQRGAAPQPQRRRAGRRGGLAGITGCERLTTMLDQRLEPVKVKLAVGSTRNR